MRNFILGVIVTLIVLVVGGLAFALLGFMPTNADATPPHLERRIATRALDASMECIGPVIDSELVSFAVQHELARRNAVRIAAYRGAQI